MSKNKSKRNVVLWSGGADSTAVLNHWGGVSCEDYPIVALSIVAHPCLNEHQIKKQNEVQARYLKHAKRKGYHIKHMKMEFSGDFSWKDTASPQPCMWLSALLQVIQDGDTVFCGYIRSDCVWHRIHEFKSIFSASCALKEIDATLKFPWEWERKVDILRRLRKGKVPDSCWFSCDDTNNGRACRKCSKCKEVSDARKALTEYDKPGKSEMIKGKR